MNMSFLKDHEPYTHATTRGSFVVGTLNTALLAEKVWTVVGHGGQLPISKSDLKVFWLLLRAVQ